MVETIRNQDMGIGNNFHEVETHDTQWRPAKSGFRRGRKNIELVASSRSAFFALGVLQFPDTTGAHGRNTKPSLPSSGLR
ncbi:hypothetical protein V494_06729 [Pseudogymnoascus sp. VKM F-4513 (FW-928)]|nr:hypothetical protein V494_06729 [Pseudogymnoascus sp. VKM F-4513 (FW-928)]